MKKAILLLGAVIVLAGICIGGFKLYMTPVSYLSIDINPSVEISVNIFNNVVCVRGFNEDGNLILNGKNVINSNVTDAVNTLIKSASDNGFIANDGTTVVSLTSETDNKDTAMNLQNSAILGASNAVKENGDTILLHKDAISLNLRKKATELGISPGKLNLIEKLQALDPTATVDQYKEAKVTDIMSKMQTLKKTLKLNVTDKDLISMDSSTDTNDVTSSNSAVSSNGNSRGSSIVVSSTENSSKSSSKYSSSKTSESNSSSDNDSEVLPAEQMPIILYSSDTKVTFENGKWGSVTAGITNQGVNGANCIKYENLSKNQYSPGQNIILPKPKNINNVTSADRLQVRFDIGSCNLAQPVKIVFNGSEDIYVVTPKLNMSNGYEIATLDISGILAKLNGRISKISFEGAGPNGWQDINCFYVDDIRIITPTEPSTGDTIVAVQPTAAGISTFPIMIYQHEDNITFGAPYWGKISAEIVQTGGVNFIKFSHLDTNVYAQTPAIIFAKPTNITGITSDERLKISLNLGETNCSQALKVIINGSNETSIITTKIASFSGLQNIYLDLSAIKSKLGGEISQIAFESAAPNGFANATNLYIGEISIVKAPDESSNTSSSSTSSQQSSSSKT